MFITISKDPELEPIRQSIDDGDTNPVQPSRDLIRIMIKFSGNSTSVDLWATFVDYMMIKKTSRKIDF